MKQLMTQPNFDLDKIKFSVDEGTFKRAVGLYENGRVTNFHDNGFTYTATVLGTRPYQVIVSHRGYDRGQCNCYLGQRDTLCKHMVATAIYAIKKGKTLSSQDKKQITSPSCGCKLGQLNDSDLIQIKKKITQAMRYIKPYRGPSKTWFAYQDSLYEGCCRLSFLVSQLPVSQQTAKLLVNILIRLDNKIVGSVDDSDGTVGGFIEETVDVLIQFAKLDPSCVVAFKKLQDRQTCFGWQEPLLQLS
ncbi:hypothetical protein DRH14_01670 [Candidatus Shapirobacteria bacterium]|nr:MAG: hypothetical protein DRH14_01670 [Candidatus Shapirobacteria bacterium]